MEKKNIYYNMLLNCFDANDSRSDIKRFIKKLDDALEVIEFINQVNELTQSMEKDVQTEMWHTEITLQALSRIEADDIYSDIMEAYENNNEEEA